MCILGCLQGNAEAAVSAADDEIQRCQHTIGDLQATVSLLHNRLEAQQADAAREVEGLKVGGYWEGGGNVACGRVYGWQDQA